MNNESPPRAWVDVDLEAIAHNLDIARQALPDTALMPVIKAGAYGHGLEPVARRLDADGIAFSAWRMRERPAAWRMQTYAPARSFWVPPSRTSVRR